ncbi:OB-fold protein [Achromobacter aegrifaciens]
MVFDIAKAQAVDKRAFNDAARQQWNRREKTCRDVACLDQWFSEQISTYSALIGTQANPAPPPAIATPESGYRAGPPLGTTRPAPAPQPTVPAADTPISAEEIFRAYDANEVAADMKFKGRLITVEGKVDSINVSFNGKPYIVLAVPGQFLSGVRLDFSKAAMPHLAKVQKGAVIRVRCEARGMVLRSPFLTCPD